MQPLKPEALNPSLKPYNLYGALRSPFKTPRVGEASVNSRQHSTRP